MRENYEEFRHRLNEYRLQLNMTQKETSSSLGITQSQFSKMERGKILVPYRVLELLMDMGWDVDYLLTGKESYVDNSELNELLEQAGEEYKKEVLAVVAWLLEQGIEKCVAEVSFETKCEIEILKMRASEETSESVLFEIRKVSGLAQIPMSEKLGVNIKKYRMLEKEQVSPDAELLLQIYEVTGCRPSLLFGVSNVESVIIDDLWGQITPQIRQHILTLVKQVIWFLKL